MCDFETRLSVQPTNARLKLHSNLMPSKPSRSTVRVRPVDETDQARAEIIKRLKRIEGQTRGIQRMIEEDRACRDILDQLAAIQQAVRGVSGLVAQKYTLECINSVQENASDEYTQETAAALVDTLLRAPR